MSPKSKKEYLSSIVLRYRKANKAEKKIILDEFCNICNYHRKYAITILNTALVRIRLKPKKKKRSGRPTTYRKKDILEALEIIWKYSNYPCSKRLKYIIHTWLPYYESDYKKLTDSNRQLLLQISHSTIDRLLKSIRPRFCKRGLSTTKPGSLLKKHIPVKTNQWDETRPGFVEADTVAHCGTSVAGQYAMSLDIVDIATGWNEQRATWGKGALVVREKIDEIEKTLPFDILGFDSDNGSEFLNYHLYNFFTERKQSVTFTRSRPYKKNDNAHVEQKNWSVIRQWIGYDRFDDPIAVEILNDLYSTEWRLYHNFFLPSVKLMDKKRIGSKTIKIHDIPRTPFERVIASKFINNKIKNKLKEQFKNLNPFKLVKSIEIKLDCLFRTVSPK